MDQEKQTIVFIDGPLNGQRRCIADGTTWLVMCQLESVFPPIFSEIHYSELVPGVWAVSKTEMKSVGF